MGVTWWNDGTCEARDPLIQADLRVAAEREGIRCRAPGSRVSVRIDPIVRVQDKPEAGIKTANGKEDIPAFRFARTVPEVHGEYRRLQGGFRKIVLVSAAFAELLINQVCDGQILIIVRLMSRILNGLRSDILKEEKAIFHPGIAWHSSRATWIVRFLQNDWNACAFPCPWLAQFQDLRIFTVVVSRAVPLADPSSRWIC